MSINAPKSELALRLELNERVAREGHQQVCKELGVSRAYLYYLINGDRKISKRIAAALGYRPDVQRVFIPVEKIYVPVVAEVST